MRLSLQFVRSPGCVAMVTLSALAAARCAAQAPAAADAERGRMAQATLPESNEALLLSSRVEDAIRAGDYRLAVELIGQIRGLPAELVAAPASRTFYPVWRQAFRLLSQLPEPGLELYRQLYDAEAKARFDEAVAKADPVALRAVFREFPLTTPWKSIGRELAARLIDSGDFGEAIQVLRQVTGPASRADPDLAAQLVVSLASAGAWNSAQRLVDELAADKELLKDPRWADRVQRLVGWVRAQSAAAVRLGGPAGPLLTPPIWSSELDRGDGREPPDDEGDTADAIDALRRLPLIAPVIDRDALLVRANGSLWALDALTLTPRWRATETTADGNALLLAPTLAGGPRQADEPRLSREAELLLYNSLRHALSTGFDLVFTIEGLTLFDPDSENFGRRTFQIIEQGAHRNVLVARRLDTGAVVWRTGDDPAGPLFQVAFQDRPLAIDEYVVALLQRDEELRLAVLDPRDGKLLREVPIVGPPTVFTKEGGRALLAADEASLYVCTGNGVVAALARQGFSWEWATVYPSTLAEHLGRLWWQPPEEPVESGIDRPVLADDLLVLAPVDSSDIFALERFSGRERWRMPRREYAYLVGALAGGLVVGGNGLVCLELDDPEGKPPRWKSVPLEVVGRPLIEEGRIYVPTRRGLVVIDGRTGKVVDDQQEASEPHANLSASTRPVALTGRGVVAGLVASPTALFSVTPGRVLKYPNIEATRRACEALAAGDANAPRVELVRAWLEALEGAPRAALARLEGLAPADPVLAEARDSLLTQLFLDLARGAGAGDDKLDWLRQAAKLAGSTDASAKLSVIIGRTLEEEQRWDDAVRHYTEVLASTTSRVLADEADPQRRLAEWLHAASRIRALGSASNAQIDAVLKRTVTEASSASADTLLRLRVALEGRPEQTALALALSLQKLPPELAVRHLPADIDEAWPEAQRRRLLLTRWDTHVALRMLDEARADGELWKQNFAGRETPSDALPGDEADRSPAEQERQWVQQIERDYQKLMQLRAAPFTAESAGYRRWRARPAELLLDTRRPLSGARPWIPIRQLESRQIQLIETLTNQFPWHKTDDVLMDESGQRGTLAELREVQPLGARLAAPDEVRRAAWPIVIDGDMAAVPLVGGLVCIGLGPARYAGTRGWDYPVAAWTSIPRDFEQTSVAGALGVYFRPRADRVVLVGWADGKLWWQRDFPGTSIQKLDRIGDRLLIVSEDQQVWTVDATFGDDVKRLAPTGGTPSGAEVVAGQLLAWGKGYLTSLSPATLEPLWSKPRNDVERCVEVHGRAWVAVRERGPAMWDVLDAGSGEPVFGPASLGDVGEIMAAAVDGDQLLVAGRVVEEAENDQLVSTSLSAFDLSGQRRWASDLHTAVAVNLTQLVGHPDFVPVLMDRPVRRERTPPATDIPAIQLVRKSDGQSLDPVPIRDKYEPQPGACDEYMLVTPTRMIVQVQGNLLAFGSPPMSDAR